MAGTIELRPDVRWSASGWIFDWVLRAAAQRVSDDQLAGDLREIVDENLGWLALSDFQDQQRLSIIHVLQQQLVPAAEAELQASIGDRAAVIDRIRTLADLARTI